VAKCVTQLYAFSLLSDYFSWNIASIEERTLTGLWELSALARRPWRGAQGSVPSSFPASLSGPATNPVFTLQPLSIGTYYITLP
jgi:hypothetical protein